MLNAGPKRGYAILYSAPISLFVPIQPRKRGRPSLRQRRRPKSSREETPSEEGDAGAHAKETGDMESVRIPP